MKDTQYLFILVLLSLTFLSSARFADNIVVAINCGGNGYDTPDDFSYISVIFYKFMKGWLFLWGIKNCRLHLFWDLKIKSD